MPGTPGYSFRLVRCCPTSGDYSRQSDVLLAGGGTGDGTVLSNTAEIYNPVADSFSAVGPMSTTRGLVQAVSLVN